MNAIDRSGTQTDRDAIRIDGNPLLGLLGKLNAFPFPSMGKTITHVFSSTGLKGRPLS